MAPKVWIKFSYKITIQVTGKHNFIILKSNMLFLDFFHFCTVNGNFKIKMQVEKENFSTGNAVNFYKKNIMHKMQQVKVQYVLAFYLFEYFHSQLFKNC